MKNRKGFVFTLDAVFALAIAVTAASILLYANFVSQSTSISSITNARSTLSNLLQVSFGSVVLLQAPYLTVQPVHVDGINPTGYAVFNGKNSYIGTSSNINANVKTVTYSFWMYSPPVGDTYHGEILAEYSTNYNSNDAFVVSFDDNSGENGGANVPTPGGIYVGIHSSLGYTVYSTNNRFDGAWHFVAIVFNVTQSTASNQIKIYVDGALQNKTEIGSHGTIQSSNFGSYPLFIGARSGGTVAPFSGYISNVQIYNISLSAGQISTLYHEGMSGSPISPEHVVAWIPLSGSIVDHSSFRVATISTNVTFSNPLYTSVGNYSVYNNDNLLSSLASLYLNSQGTAADMVLNNINTSQNKALFINNTYAPGLKVASFNGQNSSIKTASSVQVNGSISVVAWVYYGDIQPASSSPMIVDSYGVGGFGFYPHSNNDKLRLAFYSSSGTGYSIVSTVPLQRGIWSFVAATVNGTTGEMDIYINSTKNSTIIPNASCGFSSRIVTIGKYTTSNYFWNGSIANVQIYNTSLTSTQIKKLYLEGLAGTPVNYSSLVGWWPLLGNPNDYSGNGNSGYGSNVTYTNSGYTPLSLENSYQVSKSTVPLVLTNSNGITKLYNVSVVVWH